MIVSFDVAFLAAALRPAVVAAAAACLPHLGAPDRPGDGMAVDGAAVAAMRATLRAAAVDGRVVVGEGEKDEAPMLHLGERFGRAAAGDPAIDIGVDPVDGTRLAAAGRPGAMAVLAAAPRGGLFDLGPAHYLEKLVTWVPGFGSSAVDASGGTILAAIPELVAAAAERRGEASTAVRIAVQDRPRNRPYIEAVRRAGATVELFEHGDVERSLRALRGGDAAARTADEAREVPGLDAVVGIGGAPEGVIVAAGVRALGGSMLARFAPQSEGERERVLAHLVGGDSAGADAGAGRAAGPALDATVDLDVLCPGPAELIVAAVTDCEIGVALPGVRAMPGAASSSAAPSSSAPSRRVHWWTAAERQQGWADLLLG